MQVQKVCLHTERKTRSCVPTMTVIKMLHGLSLVKHLYETKEKRLIMSFANQIAPHLPLLRRYARVLTGTQKSGDNYVRATLEAIIASPSTFDKQSDPRLELYRYFHASWSNIAGKLEEAATDGLPGQKYIQAIVPIARQAFLLTAMEGFSHAQAATILGQTPDAIANLIDDAQQIIEAGLTTDVLIIEDEAIIAADLEQLVGELGHNVIGIAATRTEAVQLAKAKPFGLVLCDIQLADNSSGIDAARQILADHDVPIIFITAFPERLLTGEGLEPTYLISKPYNEDTVKAVIDQALFFHSSETKIAA